MFVCAECHDRDRDVTGCKSSFMSHPFVGNNYCDICHKRGPVIFCSSYVTKENEDKIAGVID
jgi:hypothetical protein